jgi:hypothetical protein
LETLNNSKKNFENHIKFLLLLSFTFIGRFRTVNVHADQLSDNFQTHMRLSEQLSESQAIICKPEQAPEEGFWKQWAEAVAQSQTLHSCTEYTDFPDA